MIFFVLGSKTSIPRAGSWGSDGVMSGSWAYYSMWRAWTWRQSMAWSRSFEESVVLSQER